MDAACPTCGRSFETTAGMRQHHTKVHDEALPNCVCASCEEAFYDPDAARVYCDECYTVDATPNVGRGNTEAECVECGATFLYYPSEKSGLYCPGCVADESVSCTPPQTGSRRRVTTSCASCDAELSVAQSRADVRTELFCDWECYRAGLSTGRKRDGTWSGEANPRWRGGVDTSGFYGPDWKRHRRRALERDGHTCQRCGRAADALENPIEVHHRTPVRTFDDPNEAHDLENLVTLCGPCHRAVEYRDATVEGQYDTECSPRSAE